VKVNKNDLKRSILLADFIVYLKWSFFQKYNSSIMLTESHLKVINALIDVYNRKDKKLIINLPPRSGKTEIVNTFIEWTITKHPNSKYILTSYADTLVANSSQQIRDMINSVEHKEIFNIETKKDSQSKKLWKTNKGGGVYAVSSFGQITGHGAGTKNKDEWGGCIVVDDPLKPDDSNSLLKLNKVSEWYETTLSNRKNNPDVPIIVIMQRLHTDDLVGKILKNEYKDADEWRVVKIEALNENTKTSFWEEYYPAEKLLQIRESNKPYFYSQFQQNPIVKGGNLFKSEWIRFVKREVVEKIRFEKKFITVDTALKDKEKNDFTVYTAFGVFENRLYILDMFRGKPRSVEREVTATAFYEKHSTYPFRGMHIEAKASGIDLFQRMKDSGKIVYEIERTTDKVFRAENVSPYMETHGVYIVDDIECINDFLSEYEAFPNGVHDDTIDTVIDGFEIAYSAEDIVSTYLNMLT